MALGALGCAQLAGLTDDYRLAVGGAGGAPASGGNGPNGGSLGEAGDGANEAQAGSSAGETSGGSSGALGDAGETNGGRTNGGSSSGGTSSAGTSNAGAAPAGSGNGGHPSGGSAGTSGAAGTAGAAGNGGGPRIVRVGFSEFHDSASGGDQASAHLADATFAKPAGTTTGDFILVLFGCDHSLRNLTGTDLAAKGWTLIDQHEDYGTDGQGTYLLYKFAAASEPDSFVFADINSTPSGNGVQGLLSVYRGVDPVAPLNDYQVVLEKMGMEGVMHGTTPTPAVTTTVADTLLIAGLSPDSAIDAPIVSMWPAGFSENQVSVSNPLHPYPYGWANIYSAERHIPTPGVVPASSFGWDLVGSDKYFGSLSFVLALAPK